MSKHTPGPWRLSSESPNIIKRDYTHIGLGDSSGYLIASSMGNDNSGFYATVEEGLANARLIAAAPDLLEALQIMIDFGDETACEIARKTIAKATGETP